MVSNITGTNMHCLYCSLLNDFENFDLDELNDFQLLNQIWASINGLQEDIFTPNTVSNTSHDGENQLTVTVEKHRFFIFVDSIKIFL